MQSAFGIQWPDSEGQVDFCGGQDPYALRHQNDQDSPLIKAAGGDDDLAGNA